MRFCYLMLFLWQPIWLWLLPTPLGYQSPIGAAIATALLLPPLYGVIRRGYKASVWAAYISLPYFMFAVMELWSRPPARPAAAFQLFLVVSYWVLLSRQARQLRQ